MYAYVARRVGPAAVEDLAAETFAIAFDQRHPYGHDYPDARPWLLGIATTLLRRHWRNELEVARARDIPIGTVRSRINRARRQLREPLAGVPAINHHQSTTESQP